MVSTTLLSPGVSVTISTQGAGPIPSPTTVPLIFMATRANKPSPNGSGIAPGTTQSNVLLSYTSQPDLLNDFGNVVFVTSDGVPVLTDETNEIGLLTAYSILASTSFIYVVRAPIDLGQLVSTSTAPVLPAPDQTYWINTTQIVGGILAYNGTVWTPVPFDVYTVSPTGSNGNNGDWAFDYSSLNGQLLFKNGGTWYPANTTNIQTILGATNPLWVGTVTPAGAVSGDFWYKTTSGNSGTNLALSQYQAATQLWILQPIIRSSSPPTPIQDVIWEDDSQLATTGNRPLYVGTGSMFINLPVYIQATPPTTPPATGTLWYNDDITDFALYVEQGNLWYPVVTTTVSNPNNLQKVISASPPSYPQVGAIWVNISTNSNLDNYPILEIWDGTQWVNITANVYIQSTDPGASLVPNDSYWVNTGEARTNNIVKIYDPTFVAYTVNPSGQTVIQPNNYWAPDTGSVFGRLSQRLEVVRSLQEVIVTNQQIRAEVNYYQLITVPGY
jgi:hypothetical protein